MAKIRLSRKHKLVLSRIQGGSGMGREEFFSLNPKTKKQLLGWGLVEHAGNVVKLTNAGMQMLEQEHGRTDTGPRGGGGDPG
jgi:hypothetical protein